MCGRSISTVRGFCQETHTERLSTVQQSNMIWWFGRKIGILTSCELELRHIIASLVRFKSEDRQEVCRCHPTQGELSLKDTVRKQAVTIYTATHLTRHLSKQKVLNPALACLSVPDIWLITVRPLQQRKTADEKSERLQAQPVPTATCVLTCKILPLYVSSYIPPPPSPAPGPFVQTR